MDLNKILLPVDFPNPSPGMICQAAFLARHFHSEIILLHVVPPLNYPAGMLESGVEITARDLHSDIVKGAQKELDELSRPELDGIAVRRLLLRGDPTREIVRTARDEKVGLIVMSTHGHGALYRLLLGSVATKVLHDSDCPIWVTAHVEQTPTSEFGLQNVLCAADLSSHSPTTLSQAAQVAAEFGARLTLVHVTSSVETFGPGGTTVDPVWKEEIVGFAAKEIARLQQETGTHAEVIIDNGNVYEALNRAAAKTKADVLVIGHLPSGGHLGENGSGYGIIRQSCIPVLSVLGPGNRV
ncbi:MAG: universal stress protein [Candidatus Acidiferrales bacterium]